MFSSKVNSREAHKSAPAEGSTIDKEEYKTEMDIKSEREMEMSVPAWAQTCYLLVNNLML